MNDNIWENVNDIFIARNVYIHVFSRYEAVNFAGRSDVYFYYIYYFHATASTKTFLRIFTMST